MTSLPAPTPRTEEADCAICWDDLTAENSVHYVFEGDNEWRLSSVCAACVQRVQKTQFKDYVKKLAEEDCAATKRRMLEKGPPINLRDPKMFPKDGEDAHDLEVAALFYDGSSQSAMLEGALTGEEREKYLQEQRTIFEAETFGNSAVDEEEAS